MKGSKTLAPYACYFGSSMGRCVDVILYGEYCFMKKGSISIMFLHRTSELILWFPMGLFPACFYVNSASFKR